jgi:hypothetical protein
LKLDYLDVRVRAGRRDLPEPAKTSRNRCAIVTPGVLRRA